MPRQVVLAQARRLSTSSLGTLYILTILTRGWVNAEYTMVQRLQQVNLQLVNLQQVIECYLVFRRLVTVAYSETCPGDAQVTLRRTDEIDRYVCDRMLLIHED